MPRWPARGSPPFAGKFACAWERRLSCRASKGCDAKNSRARGNAASAHLAPDNTKPLANAPMAGAGLASFHRKTRVCVGTPFAGGPAKRLSAKTRVRMEAPLQHISRRTTQNRSQNVPMAGVGLASFCGKTCMHGTAAHGNCQRQPSKKNLRTHGSASSAHLAPNNTKPRANAPMAGADGIARFSLARANVSGARHAEAPTGGKPSKRGSVLQRAEAPPRRTKSICSP